ncbi:BLOC-3 complex member HPS1 isoform X2 [Cylas formicarius]|uniref:BLOC-3 complex member HPS1 isoform X2 n=1 Tax=Cylas formicarius TaxID=197179 RepID=UPI002958C6A9|nr:BLOC-3 complex member HPS1 isoform X2 [Cylas formicarius]
MKMNCLLIFDHLNDIIFMKYDDPFENHIKKFALSEGLLLEGDFDAPLNRNIIIQLFSPIVTSHRIMHCQFGNSYTSMKFKDELKMLFNEFMGYLFLGMTSDENDGFLNICITFVRYLCGPDVYQLLLNKERCSLLHKLYDNWLKLKEDNQAFLVEALEQLVINSDLSNTCLEALKESVTQLSLYQDLSRVHALLLVKDKFLSLYSSSNAKQLSAPDILFTIILTHCRGDVFKNIESYRILLAGPETEPKCIPHAIHIVEICDQMFLVYLMEIGNPSVAGSLYDAFCHLHTIQSVQIQRDKETLQLAFENLDLATKKLNISLKKNKNTDIEASHKQLMKKWDVIKKKYQEYLKTGSEEAILRAETLLLGFLENLKQLLTLSSVDDSVLDFGAEHVLNISQKVKKDLSTFTEFFTVKGIKNFTFGSYLEDFPGLVHFLFVDRNTHRITTPALEWEENKAHLTKKKIWQMVKFSQRHLQEGHTSLIWKDSAFTCSFFLWFEDSGGSGLKTTSSPGPFRSFPGILTDHFYTKMKETCFPKTSPLKVKCFELFCIHLGLVTPSCVLEQARRLAATIWELKGFPSSVADLL